MGSQPGTIWGREPAMVPARVQAVIALVVAFGLNLAPDQLGAILAVTAVILGFITRSRVSPATTTPQSGTVTCEGRSRDADGPTARRPRCRRRGRRISCRRGGARRRPAEYGETLPGRPASAVGPHHRAVHLHGRAAGWLMVPSLER